MPDYKVGDKFYCDSNSNHRIEILAISPKKNKFGNWVYFIEETMENMTDYLNYESVQFKYINDCFNPL